MGLIPSSHTFYRYTIGGVEGSDMLIPGWPQGTRVHEPMIPEHAKPGQVFRPVGAEHIERRLTLPRFGMLS